MWLTRKQAVDSRLACLLGHVSSTHAHNMLIVLRFCIHLQLWPVVSLINYKYVPLKLRVLVMQAIAFFW